MANATWPATLPDHFQAGGLQGSRRDNVLRAHPEVGPAKTRRRSTLAIRRWSGTIRLDPTQAATFETFYETTLASGTLPFDWVDPRTGSTTTFTFTAPPGGPTPYLRGQYWDYTLALEEVPA